MIPSWTWTTRLALLALVVQTASAAAIDTHLKPRSPWSRRHQDPAIVRRQAPAGGVDLPTTPLVLVGEATSVDPATLSSTSSASISTESSTESSTSTTTTDSSSFILPFPLPTDLFPPSSSSESTSTESSTTSASSFTNEGSAVSSTSELSSTDPLSTTSETSSEPSTSPSVIVSLPLDPGASSTSEVSSTPTDAPLSSTTSAPDVSSTSSDPVTSSSSNDGGILSSIISVISSIVDPPPSSSSTEDPVSSTSSDIPVSSSSDVPVSSSSTDDGGATVITDPPISSTSSSFVSSSTSEVVSSSSSSKGGFDFNVTSVLPGGPSSIDTDDVTTITSTSSISVSIRSEFNYLTGSSLAFSSIESTSTSVTITDPDAPVNTLIASTTPQGVTLTVSAVPLPTNMPQFIKPSDQSDPVDVNSGPSGYTLINILFRKELAWPVVLSNAETAGQLMAFVPALVTAILNLPGDAIKLVGLQAYAGPDYQTSEKTGDIQTLLLFYIPTDQVTTLKSYVTTPGSIFYTTGNDLTKQITSLVVKTYTIAATDDTTQNASNNPSSNSKIDNSRRNAIIGVCVAFGAIALGVFIWWFYKTRQQRREGAHRRLSYQSAPNYGTTGAAPMMGERGYNNNGSGGRRNSFYAFGQENDSLEDETYDYMSQHSLGSSGAHGAPPVRRHVAGQPISQPILRETSMGHW